MNTVGLAALLVAIIALSALHVIGRAMSPVRRTISEYALLGSGPRALSCVFALCLAAAGTAVRHTLGALASFAGQLCWLGVVLPTPA